MSWAGLSKTPLIGLIMTQNGTIRKQRSMGYLVSMIIAGTLIVGCCSIVVGVTSLLGFGATQSILFFYSPQIVVFALVIGLIVNIIIAVRKHKLAEWKTYIPLIILVIYCFGVFVTSRLIVVGDAIPRKITNADNRIWSDGMVGRARGGYPTGTTCVLSEQVVLLMGEWSFITPDGHMPALTWTENSIPDSRLPGSPRSCTPLQNNWYICYLSKPYQLFLDKSVVCQ